MKRASLTTLFLVLSLVIAASRPGAQSSGSTGLQRGDLPLPGRSSAPVPNRISSLTVEAHLSEVAGTYVLLPAVRVETVVSERVFSIREPLIRDQQTHEDERPLVLVGAGFPELARGTTLEVTGWIVTLPTAARIMGRDWGGEVDDDFFKHHNRAVIVANLVRALDGAELYSRP
jgi:hypothetical protein